MPNANASSFCDTTTHQTADLPQGERWFFKMLTFDTPAGGFSFIIRAKPQWSWRDKYRNLPSGLTMPSSTLKPSWNLGWGRLIIAMVTGGQCTILSLTYFWLFKSYKRKYTMKYIFKQTTKCCKTAVWKFLKTSKSLKLNCLSFHCWTRMQTAPSSVAIFRW